MKMPPRKVFAAALVLTMSSQALAQTILQPHLPNNLPLRPDILSGILSPCGDRAMTPAPLPPTKAEKVDDGLYRVTVDFSGISISKSRNFVACTLYSKLPKDLADSGRRFRLMSSTYTVKATMSPKTRANASFGLGMVEPEEASDVAFAPLQENKLQTGNVDFDPLNAHLNRTTTPADEPKPDLSKLMTRASLLKNFQPLPVIPRLVVPVIPVVPRFRVLRATAAPTPAPAPLGIKYTFYNPALVPGIIQNLFMGIPLILKTLLVVVEGSGDANLSAENRIALEIPDSERDAVIEGDQYIANQFQMWFTTKDSDNSEATISVNAIELVLMVDE